MHSNTTRAAPEVVSVLMGGRRNDKCRSTASAGYNTNVLSHNYRILQLHIKTICDCFVIDA